MNQEAADNKETGPLRPTLLLQEEQEGVAGTSVTAWAIEGDGGWAVARWAIDLKGSERPGSRVVLGCGKLAQQELASLARVVEEEKMSDLPAVLGEKPKINAHIYRLQWGEARTSLFGVPPFRHGTLENHLLASAPTSDLDRAWKRFARIAGRIVACCQVGEPPALPLL